MNINFIFPECDSEGVNLKTDINIGLLSDDNSLVTSSIVITINGNSALIGEDFQCGFSGSLIQRWDGYDGYDYYANISPLTSYPASKSIKIDVYAIDGYTVGSDSCVFSTKCSDCLEGIFLATSKSTNGVFGVYDADDVYASHSLLWDRDNTNIRIVGQPINDINCKRVRDNTYITIATGGGVSIVKNCISSLCYGGDVDGYELCYATSGHYIDGYGVVLDGYGYCDNFNAKTGYIDNLTNLYILNLTQNRVEVFYDIEDDVVGRSIPEYIYDSSTILELDGYINNMLVVEYLSSIDNISNTIFLSTTTGLLRIDTDESVHGFSESNMYVRDYGIMGSGRTYEIIGGLENNIIDVSYNEDNYLLAVAAQNSTTGSGNVTIIDTRVDAQLGFYDNYDWINDVSFFPSESDCYIGDIEDY